jgi:hypothetical protein
MDSSTPRGKVIKTTSSSELDMLAFRRGIRRNEKDIAYLRIDFGLPDKWALVSTCPSALFRVRRLNSDLIGEGHRRRQAIEFGRRARHGVVVL